MLKTLFQSILGRLAAYESALAALAARVSQLEPTAPPKPRAVLSGKPTIQR